MPEFLQPWEPYFLHFLVGGGAVVVLVLLLIVWQLFGRGPRRRRALRSAQRLLMQGAWEQALNSIRHLKDWKHSPAWSERLHAAEANCLWAAMQSALQQKNFEQAVEYGQRAAELQNQSPEQMRQKVADVMLAEVRRLFAATAPGSSTAPLHDIISRTLLVQNRNREASFWHGLVHIRDGRPETAAVALETARSGEGGISWTFDTFTKEGGGEPQPAKKAAYIDPSLYLGALLLREGKAKEALRYLTEANRVDPGCPFVATQLGCALIAADGDTQLAVRALQRALGARGFAQWSSNPQRAWVEGLPERSSFVRRLASDYTYTCPLFGGDLRVLLHQANVALGQGLYRMGNFQEASQVFGKLLQESAPSFAVLRGLGLSLARMGQYDEAFRHLRTAHDLAGENDRMVAGFLALCGAKGKPKQDEDKLRNASWAIRTVGKFTAPKDAEWANLISSIFAEARGIGLAVSADDQIYLCEHLLSVRATDAQAAEAYHHLQATHPQRMHREYAWLYCRAAQQHHLSHELGLELFALTFADELAARQFYDQEQWDLRDAEFAYLEQAAARAPGHFPSALGPEYAPRGEKLLLERSAELEKTGQNDAALAVAEMHCRLVPHSPAALDRLANLHYRRGNIDRAIELLRSWQASGGLDALPLVRLAVIHGERRELDRCLNSIYQALQITGGRQRAEVAFLGARLSLKGCFATNDSQVTEAAPLSETMVAALKTTADLLLEALKDCPDHVQALWLLAAVRWLRGDKGELAQQAPLMNHPEVGDPRFHLLAGVCNLAAQNYPQALAACARALNLSEKDAKYAALAVEAIFLAGWAHLLQGDTAAALKAFGMVANAEQGPSRGHAQALLGKIAFDRQKFESAIEWWKELDSDRRNLWNLAQPLAGAIFLSAVQSLQGGHYKEAADRIREAGRLGWRDRRLGQLLTLTLAKAGQKLLYS